MPRLKIKHPSPRDEFKNRLLQILADQDIYATKVAKTWDGFVVILSSERETDTLFEPTCLEALKAGSYTPILPPEQKAKRSILLFGVDEEITHRSSEDIQAEIYRVNEFTQDSIESVFHFEGKPMMKITFLQTAPALKSQTEGLKMFNMRIPPHQIKEQEFFPINTCMRCYAIDEHVTNKCPKPKEHTVCSECGSQEHKFFDCKNTTKQCLNCSGNHRTLAYKCPQRQKAIESAKEKKKAKANLTYSGATSSNLIPSQSLFSPDAANKILTCLLQAHVMNAAEPGCFQSTLNEWLELNNLPSVVAPQNPNSSKLFHSAPLTPPNLTAAAQSTATAEELCSSDEEAENEEAETDPDDEVNVDVVTPETTVNTLPLQPPCPPTPNPQKTKKKKTQSPPPHSRSTSTSRTVGDERLPSPPTSSKPRTQGKSHKSLRPR